MKNLTDNQKKIASATIPYDKITRSDFIALRKSNRKNGSKKK